MSSQKIKNQIKKEPRKVYIQLCWCLLYILLPCLHLFFFFLLSWFSVRKKAATCVCVSARPECCWDNGAESSGGGGQCPLVARWPPPRGTPESDSLLLFLSTPNTINVNCVCYLHSTNWAARCFSFPQTSFDNHRRVWTKQRTNLFEKFPNEIQISRQISITNFWNQNE